MTSRPSHAARRAMLIALVATATLMLACIPGKSAAPSKWDSRTVAESIQGVPFTPVIVNSNVGRGPTRLALAMLQKDQTLVLQAEVTARVYRLDNEPEKNPGTAQLLGSYQMAARTIDTADHGVMRLGDRDDARHTFADVALRAPQRAETTPPAHDGALVTIFTTMVDFSEAGMWGADLQVTTGGKTYKNLQLTFAVLDKTAEPSIGDKAPATKQKIAKDVANLGDIDSATKPNASLHNITVADAIANGKPTIVAFVTPAFCQTRYCGPVLQSVVVPLQQQYGDRANVIHIEPYDVPLARKGTLSAVPAVSEWDLRNEPFIFVVNGKGIVSAKFEGIIDLDEVKQALDATLAAK